MQDSARLYGGLNLHAVFPTFSTHARKEKIITHVRAHIEKIGETGDEALG